MLKRLSIPALTLLVTAWTGSASATVITNGSFETGSFAGWTTQDLALPFFPLSIQQAGTANTFGWPWSSSPTDGVHTAFHGFDGDGVIGPNPIRIAQDVTVTAGAPIIAFDYRGAWDLTFGAQASRLFDVNIEAAGGGANLANFSILTALPNSTVFDTGQLTGAVDLSAFIGQTVHLAFDWFVPETFTGPAQFQLDNVRGATPAPATLALFSLGLAGLSFSRRRKA
jgi:hypothetical protein